MLTEETITCKRCGVAKALDSFYVNRHRLLGRDVVCSECRRAYKLLYRGATPRSAPKARYNECACGRRKLLASNTCRRCRLCKGGRTINSEGYVLVRAEGHPRAQKRGHYVFEHILVMEAFLGRFLYPEETVHHKYGIKTDNNLEDLELWVRPQPRGHPSTRCSSLGTRNSETIRHP